MNKLVPIYTSAHVFHISVQVAINTNQVLQTKDARKDWERHFNVSYVKPVLDHLDTCVTKALDLVANDKQQGM